MCGVVGYIGKKDARSIILSGLEKLEYRGYDSAGIALLNNKKRIFEIYKDKGRINHLKSLCDFSFSTNTGIGHTRWATHGEPSYNNSHPHTSNNGRFIIVHNGVIENFRKLKVEILDDYNFYSQTDTEVIVNLIQYYSDKMCMTSVIRKIMSLLEGSYAIVIIDKETPDILYAVKNKTPLLIGKDNDGIVIASDTLALVGYSDEYYYMEDQRFAVIKENSIKEFDLMGFEREVKLTQLNNAKEITEKGEYAHFMLKEIEEQPGVIRRLISNYFDDDDNINIDYEILDIIGNASKINFVGCGTSMHASLLGKYYFEKLCSIPTEVFVASELVYSQPLPVKNSIYIFVSQSGETADCISIMKKCKQNNIKTILITNSVNSTMSHLANSVLDICAGKEIAVASTKAYVAQVATLSILARAVSGKRTNLKNNLKKIAITMEEIISNKSLIKSVAKQIINNKSVFFIGRGIDYWVCLESALKLKEISYIHTEAFSSGELKHGTIALIEKDTPVIAIITQEGTNSIVRSNQIETTTRGAKGFIISSESLSTNEDYIVIPNVAHYLTPLITVVVTQLLAYYCALYKGNDVDKPKNLAKSVTVE